MAEASRLGAVFTVAHPGHLALNFWRYRTLLRYLILRNLRVQYKQSMFGYAWVLLNPLAQLLVMSFVFSRILHAPGQSGVPFILFALVGLTPWVFFSNSVAAAAESISSGGSLITVIYFPREILTAAAVLTRLIDLAAGLVLLLVVMVWVGQPVGWSILWLIPILFVQILFTLGLAFPLAAMNLFFRDTRFLVAVGLYLWFFLTPVMYPVEAVPDEYRMLYDLNPMSRLISAYRYALLTNVAPPIDSLLVATLTSLAVLYVGYRIFKKVEPGFADNI